MGPRYILGTHHCALDLEAAITRLPKGILGWDFDYHLQVPLLVPEAAARRAGSSSRLAGPTRHPVGSQD